MTEYTYADVIIDPEDPRVKIGKEYYFAYTPTEALNIARNGLNNCMAHLASITVGGTCPFKSLSGAEYVCILRKKDYEEEQAEWIKQNNIKIGDEVEITWHPETISYLGSTGNINNISEEGITVTLNGGCWTFTFPYFVLKKIEELEKKYIPFDLSKEEDREFLRDRWIKSKIYVYEYKILSFYKVNGRWVVDTSGDNSLTAEDLFYKFVFSDNTPCGKEVDND